MKTKLLWPVGCLLAALLAAPSIRGFIFITDNRAEGALPLKWPAGTFPIQIKLGSDTSLGDGTNFSTSAQAAAQAWNSLLGNLQITTSIVAPGASARSNGVNELVFAPDIFGEAFDTNVIAVTTVFSRGNERTQADIVFNSNRTWDSYRGPRRGSVIDLQRVALHELGHALGMDHPDEAGQTVVAMMNSRVSDLDVLSTDDTTGVQQLYGPPGTPPNNNHANAANITLTNSAAIVTGFNTNATKEPGEPNHAGNTGGSSVWWRWTAPSPGSVTLDTRGSYSDTTMGVYTGASVSALITIASNDDISATPHIQASSVTFNAIGGVTYFIAVDGFDGDASGLTLTLSFSPVSGTVPTITAQPLSTTVTTGTSIVFSVTATAGTSPITYQWQFNGVSLAGATSSTLSLVASAATAGTYAVIVSTSAGSVSSDSITLTVNAAPPPPPPPSSRGGGGGAPSLWFWGALSLLAFARFFRRL